MAVLRHEDSTRLGAKARLQQAHYSLAYISSTLLQSKHHLLPSSSQARTIPTRISGTRPSRPTLNPFPTAIRSLASPPGTNPPLYDMGMTKAVLRWVTEKVNGQLQAPTFGAVTPLLPQQPPVALFPGFIAVKNHASELLEGASRSKDEVSNRYYRRLVLRLTSRGSSFSETQWVRSSCAPRRVPGRCEVDRVISSKCAADMIRGV